MDDIYSLEAFKMKIRKSDLLFYARDFREPSEAMIRRCKFKRVISRGPVISTLIPCHFCGVEGCNRVSFLDPKGRKLAKTAKLNSKQPDNRKLKSKENNK